MDEVLTVLIEAVREAGAAIVGLREKGVTLACKENNDLLTHADLQANQILKSRLCGAFPEYGWLSEESVDDEARLSCRRVWVVDPIDGTREYVAGLPEYVVSVALVEDGVVILACVFNPATRELFSAKKGYGAFLNNTRVRCRSVVDNQLMLLASRAECERGEWQRFGQEQVKPVGSIAYKLGLVAAGLADATFSLGHKSEWDVAAGVLLVSEAGGVVTNRCHQPLRFNQNDVLVDGVIAVSACASSRVMAIIAR